MRMRQPPLRRGWEGGGRLISCMLVWYPHNSGASQRKRREQDRHLREFVARSCMASAQQHISQKQTEQEDAWHQDKTWRLDTPEGVGGPLLHGLCKAQAVQNLGRARLGRGAANLLRRAQRTQQEKLG